MAFVVRFIGVAVLATVALQAQPFPGERVPTATLIPATTVTFGAGADSNSPAVWELIDGRNQLFLFTSFNGWSTRHSGTAASTLVTAAARRLDGGYRARC